MKDTLLCGDCAEKMRDLAPNSIDAIVTDPPYGLAFMGAKWDNFGGKSCGNDSAEVRRQKAEEYAAKNSGAPRYANGHGGAPTLNAMHSFQSAMTPIFAEALRVAKPGAYLLAFGGIERDPHYYEIAQKRIEQSEPETFQMELPL